MHILDWTAIRPQNHYANILLRPQLCMSMGLSLTAWFNFMLKNYYGLDDLILQGFFIGLSYFICPVHHLIFCSSPNFTKIPRRQTIRGVMQELGFG